MAIDVPSYGLFKASLIMFSFFTFTLTRRAKNPFSILPNVVLGETKATTFDWASAIPIDDARAQLVMRMAHLGHSEPSFYPTSMAGKFDDSSIFAKEEVDFEIITKRTGEGGERPHGLGRHDPCFHCCFDVVRWAGAGEVTFDVGKSYYFKNAGFAVRIVKASVEATRLNKASTNFQQSVEDPASP